MKRRGVASILVLSLVVTSFALGSKVCNNAVQNSAVTAFRGSLTKQ